MIFIEPLQVYACRAGKRPFAGNPALSVADRNEAFFEPLRCVDGWDEHILSFVDNESRPVGIMELVSQLRKRVPHRNKQHKEKLKRDILLRVGALIRNGNLIRIQRKFVLVRRDAVAS